MNVSKGIRVESLLGKAQKAAGRQKQEVKHINKKTENINENKKIFTNSCVCLDSITA